MTPATALAMLDRQLAASGEAVTVRRAGRPDVTCTAAVRALSGAELRSGWNGVQLTGRAVLSPSAFPAGFLPLRTGDKLVRGGQERAIGWADNKALESAFVRITVDFAG